MGKLISYGDECPLCGLEEGECECDPALILKLRSEEKKGRSRKQGKKKEN